MPERSGNSYKNKTSKFQKRNERAAIIQWVSQGLMSGDNVFLLALRLSDENKDDDSEIFTHVLAQYVRVCVCVNRISLGLRKILGENVRHGLQKKIT